MTPKHARLLADLKQEEVAKVLGVHRATYAAMEKDPGKFTVRQAWLFCRTTGRELEEVFKEGKHGHR